MDFVHQLLEAGHRSTVSREGRPVTICASGKALRGTRAGQDSPIPAPPRPSADTAVKRGSRLLLDPQVLHGPDGVRSIGTAQTFDPPMNDVRLDPR